MSTEGDRRAQGASRIPFEALVEVGGALGPSFEAQAVNISEEGMQLRTAYLPETGQPLTCRFDAGPGHSVLASGEVIWTEQAGKGGEFGIRFTDMDPESIDILRRMCGISQDPAAPQAAPGAKVRLHIDGLASPMRARVKGSQNAEVTVGSDLGFLQVGKELDLEDAESGTKRAAKIDRVDVAVDPASHIPQLVVTLRYADAEDSAADMSATSHDAPKPEAIPVEEDAPAPAATMSASTDDDTMEKASRDMKGAFARGVSSIGPAFAKIANRAKTTVALLAAKRAASSDDRDAPRRTTAPAPGGGLRATGRKVFRSESTSDAQEEGAMEPKFKVTKRKVAIAGAVVVAVTLGAIAMRKPHAAPAVADTTTAASTSTAALTATHLPPLPKPEPVTANIGAPPPMAGAPGALGSPMGAQAPGAPQAPMAMGAPPEPEVGGASPNAKDKDKNKKHGKVTPFSNGPVSHGNVLHLKMDGQIEQIQGAAQPTGFTVKIPGRKSLEAAGPLAARDGRIAAVKVTNDGAGAELTFTFKDGVPNYQVRAKGDTLEISLAPAGKAHGDKQIAKKGGDKKHGTTAKKHDKAPDKH